MFDALRNLGNLPELMRKAQQMQGDVKRVQEEMARAEVTGDAGEGRVTVTVNGRMEVLKIRIDKLRIDVSNVELLEDLILAATRTAQNRAMEMVRTEMNKVAQEAGFPPEVLP